MTCEHNIDIVLGTGWKNAEWRTYQFLDLYGDQEASIRETEASWQRRKGRVGRVTDSRRKELQQILLARLQSEYELMLLKQKTGTPPA